MPDNDSVRISREEQSGLVAGLMSDSQHGGLIGGYCEEGFPIYFVNDDMVRMLGYDSQEELVEAIGGLVANTIHPDDMPQVARDLGDSYYEGMRYETTYRMPRKDGTWFWIVDRGRVVRTEDGRLAILSLCCDMTEFLEQHAELEKQNAWSMHTLENMPGGYHRCAAEEGYPFLYISQRFLDIFGWTREEIATRFDNKFNNMIHPEDRQLTDTYMADICQKCDTDTASDQVYRMLGKDGYHWVTGATTMVQVGEQTFYQGSIVDVTNFVQREEKDKADLHQALAEAEQANRSKTNFLFNISHEIRTPLNAVLGFIQMAQRQVADEQVGAMLDKADLASRQLLDTINEILDMSRIQSGKVTLNEGVIDVKERIQQVDALFRNMAESKELQFHVIDETTVPYISGDGQRIAQVLTNLIGNAIKFTPKGGNITYSVREARIDRVSERVYYDVRVMDDGIGMSQKFQRDMYRIFEREQNPTTSQIQGTGLGLSIAKSLVDMMGDSLDCNSQLGKGTEFIYSCSFPIAARPPQEQVRAENLVAGLSLKGLRILLVEDNELNREIATALLEDKAVQVESAVNGMEAVEMVMSSSPGYYDLVLMDVQMPIMDGYQATREIRRLKNRELARIPIIAMTANAFAEDREMARRAGMNGHIAKPLSIEAFYQTISQVLGL